MSEVGGAPALLEIEGLSAFYGSAQALEDVYARFPLLPERADQEAEPGGQPPARAEQRGGVRAETEERGVAERDHDPAPPEVVDERERTGKLGRKGHCAYGPGGEKPME